MFSFFFVKEVEPNSGTMSQLAEFKDFMISQFQVIIVYIGYTACFKIFVNTGSERVIKHSYDRTRKKHERYSG